MHIEFTKKEIPKKIFQDLKDGEKFWYEGVEYVKSDYYEHLGIYEGYKLKVFPCNIFVDVQESDRPHYFKAKNVESGSVVQALGVVGVLVRIEDSIFLFVLINDYSWNGNYLGIGKDTSVLVYPNAKVVLGEAQK